jgi:GNAT superfamily N-acetyltransferase
VIVRQARAGDADAVADVFIPSFAGLTFLPSLHTDDETRAWIRDVVLPRYEVWVAVEQERVVGFAAISDDMLEHLYVHPSAQSRGVGTELLGLAKKRRPGGFGLWVFQRNEGARRFYERHGCRLVELTNGESNMEREPDALYEWRPPPTS